jgi:hypothetical protein
MTGGDPNNPKSRNADTHHIMVSDATVTSLANGFRVSGPATITGNGNFPPPFGPNTTVQIDVLGGNTVDLSNIKLTFIGDAATHFGTQPVNRGFKTFNDASGPHIASGDAMGSIGHKLHVSARLFENHCCVSQRSCAEACSYTRCRT